MARTDFHKVIIGRSEMLSFLDPAIENVPAKTDTGAYRSAVHADEISLSDDGKTLSFRLLGGHPNSVRSERISTRKFSKVNVSNSAGDREDRYEVKLKVKIGPKIILASFSLANRVKKPYPILLGRQVLNNRFLVDTAETSVDRAELKSRYGLNFPQDEENGKE